MANLLLDPLPAPVTHKGVSYRPDIDGLRTVAVLAVVLYHAAIGPMSGGFVGVDIFFVISGYLIMSTLASDIAADRFSVVAFYERRIRRIFPALFTMMAVVTVVAALVLSPSDFARYGQSLMAAAGSFSNLHFEFSGRNAGYFSDTGEARLLLHTWSLSVEEQFYVMLPIALLLLRGRSRRTLVAELALFAAASFVVSVVLVATRPIDAFYLVFPRAWELLSGCLLALVPLPAVSSRWPRELASLAGLAVILVAAFGFTRTTPFPGTAALLPCLGAVLLISSGSAGSTLVGRALSTRPSVYIGRISYSLYLWHWPVIVQVHSLDGGSSTFAGKVLILTVSFAAAILSFHFVEQPFRRIGRSASARRWILSGGATAVVATMLLGLVLVRAGGLPDHFDRLVAANLTQATAEPSSKCYHFLRKVTDEDDFRACDEDRPQRRNIVVLGDSHAGSLLPLLRTMEHDGDTGRLGIVSAIVSGCPLSDRLGLPRDDSHCNDTTRFAYARALAPDVDLVILAFSPWWLDGDGLTCASRDDVCGRALSPLEAENLFMAELDERLRMLLDAGKKVVVQLPIPTYDKSIPRYMISKIIYGRLGSVMNDLGTVRPLQRQDYLSITTRLAALAKRDGVVVFDARAALCTGLRCRYERDDVSLYMDNNHIAANRIDMFRAPLEAALNLARSGDMAAAR